MVLGVTIAADGATVLVDESSAGDESFMFGEILVGDFVEVRGVDDGSPSVRALSIRRDDATAGADDVRLEGPVTALDTAVPSIDILGQHHVLWSAELIEVGGFLTERHRLAEDVD